MTIVELMQMHEINARYGCVDKVMTGCWLGRHTPGMLRPLTLPLALKRSAAITSVCRLRIDNARQYQSPDQTWHCYSLASAE